MAIAQARQRRTVMDFLVILVGVALLGFAMWAGPLALGDSQGEIADPNLVWAIYFFAGAFAIASQFVGQWWRRRGIARALLVVAALALLGGLAGYRDFGARALLTMLLPAIVLLAAVPMVGPMPDPDGPSADDRAHERGAHR